MEEHREQANKYQPSDIKDGISSSKRAVSGNFEDQLAAIRQRVASRLVNLANECEGLRRPIEERWVNALLHYYGRYTPDDAKALKKGKSQAFVNLTRPRTDLAISRMSEIVFPADDRNWDITDTPVPDDPDAQYVGDKKPVDLMRDEIDDQLQESEFSSVGRAVIRFGCILGTGVMRGPVMIAERKKVWSQIETETGETVWQVEFIEREKPGVKLVPTWNFFPDPSAASAESAEYFFEREYLTRSQVKNLAMINGVLCDELAEVLSSPPVDENLPDFVVNARAQVDDLSIIPDTKDRYRMWKYTGPIPVSDLICGNVDIPDGIDKQDEVYGEVWVLANRVIKIALTLFDYKLVDYHVWGWKKDEMSIFGFGVPDMMFEAQRIVNASWRLMLDDAAASIGNQIVVDKSQVYPADGEYGFDHRTKVWIKKHSDIPADHAFRTYSFPSHQAQLANIYNMIHQLVDEISGIPQISMGVQTEQTTKTAHGMSLLMNAHLVSMKDPVKRWDDYITKPLISAFYDWNMEYNLKPEIKGDFKVKTRGASTLLLKETQAKNVAALITLLERPQFQQRANWDELFDVMVTALQFDPETVGLSDEELQQKQKEAQNQPPSPDQIKAQVEMQKLQLQQSKAQTDAQLKQAEIQSRERVAQINYQADLARLAAEQDLTMAQLDARLREIAIKGQQRMEEKMLDVRGKEHLMAQEVKAETLTDSRLM